MGLLNSTYFTQEWADGLKGAVSAYTTGATILIARTIGKPVLDPVTGLPSAPGRDVLYEGAARVTPRRASSVRLVPMNTTTIQSVQFQISIGEDGPLDIRPGMILEVNECELNPVLTTYMYSIDEIVDSSNPIEQTFWAKVDNEVVRNG